MSQPPGFERFTTRQHRSVYLAGFVFIFGVAQRRLALLDDPFSMRLAVGILAAFTLLYAAQPWLFRRTQSRFSFYPRLYFALQMILVQLLGLFEEYLDTWLALYILLGMQVAACCSRKEALAWGSLFIASSLLTLSFEFGLLSGLGRGLAYIILGLFLISFDIQYARSEDARTESQVLLKELQVAHEKLKEQAIQAELLAAAQERNRIAQEVHDAVGQKVFAIQLMAETACVLLENDPPATRSHLAMLQEGTQAALGQMRALIERWRTPSQGGAPADPLHLPADS